MAGWFAPLAVRAARQVVVPLQLSGAAPGVSSPSVLPPFAERGRTLSEREFSVTGGGAIGTIDGDIHMCRTKTEIRIEPGFLGEICEAVEKGASLFIGRKLVAPKQ